MVRTVPLSEMAEEIDKFYLYIAPLGTTINVISITACVPMATIKVNTIKK